VHSNKKEGGRLIPALSEDTDKLSVDTGGRMMNPNENFKLMNYVDSQQNGEVFYARRKAYDKELKSYSGLEGRTTETMQDKLDTRSISLPDLRAKCNEAADLTEGEREVLFNMLLEYQQYFTARPGKCTLMRYQFEVTSPEGIVGTSRPIPFAVRADVRAQISQLLKDDIIERSNSSFINPLTVVLRQGKTPRICLDARRVNKYTIPDRARVSPIQELLQ